MLGRTVIIVDEVDDLVVNENPNSNYVKEDAERTPDLRKCFAALKADEYTRTLALTLTLTLALTPTLTPTRTLT